MWRNWLHYETLVGLKNNAATMENGIAAPQRIKNRTTVSSSNPIYECISKRITSRFSKIYVHTHVQ